GCLERLVEGLGGGGDLVAALAERADVNLPGCDRTGPDDPELIGPLLDRCGDDPGRPDPVAAHRDRTLDAVGIEVGRPERLRVARPELEDVADLDRRLDLDRVAAR